MITYCFFGGGGRILGEEIDFFLCDYDILNCKEGRVINAPMYSSYQMSKILKERLTLNIKKWLFLMSFFLVFSATSVYAANQGWQASGKDWYYYESGQTVKNDWRLVENNWYYFNESGKMVTGWKNIKGYWFAFQPSGQMRTGWFLDGKTWYLLDENGYMRVGWYKENGTWYYLTSNGAMATGWVITDYSSYPKKWSYFNTDGSMRYNELAPARDGHLYVIQPDGYLLTKTDRLVFTTRDGKNYFIRPNKNQGYIAIANEWYFSLGYEDCIGLENCTVAPLIKEFFVEVEPNTEINPADVIKHIQNYSHKQFLGKDGQLVSPQPVVNVEATISHIQEVPVLMNPSVEMNLSGFMIVNNQLVYRSQEEVEGKIALRTGYIAILGDSKLKEYSLLLYANEDGTITHMKRLGTKVLDFIRKPMDGFPNDRIVINGDGEVEIVKR